MPRAEDAEALANTSGRAGRGARLHSLGWKYVEVAFVYSYMLRLCLDHDVFYSGERVPDDDWKAVGDCDAAGRHGMDPRIMWAVLERDISDEASEIERK